MTKLSRWAETFTPKTSALYRLEAKNDTTALFSCKERVGKGIPCYGWTSPVYHVWINDKWELVTMNYHEAYEYYKRRCEEIC